jgi:hypothetical protein
MSDTDEDQKTREDQANETIATMTKTCVDAVKRGKIEPGDALLVTCLATVTQELVELNRTMKLIRKELADGLYVNARIHPGLE